jgi:hypothetical protein
MIKQTRLKVVLAGLILGLIEGLAKVALSSFPVIEVLSFQSAIIGAYLAARTTSGIKAMAMGNGDSEESERHEIPSDRPAVTMVMDKPEKP